MLDIICDKIKFLISTKCDIRNSISYNYGKIKIDSYNSLPTKKILIFHNVIILIKSVVDKNKNNYSYNKFLEISLCKYKSNKQNFWMCVCIL